ncbi:helix-turn-helix domain-containing protein [Clostridium perfringens]|uniref:Helix-turn-helix transcriptional regulator n=1 Tax=Clostridium perfringens TaxID=1502 RepID=A0A8H9UWC8_CLOPF|nr:helix-turn-helix domain-containing protein [Clostridium perfringens]MDM0460985.1 helix-turn-helix domain-containing protein [Clostridium perfringens]HAT4307262.1 helix-turn-helix transcriptional regulator [Clostridium perfringens]
MNKTKVTCEMEITLLAMGGKWKPLILYYLIENGTKRFGEIMSYLNSVSQKTLTKQLRELERDGLINRKIYAEVPPKVEYSITKKGSSLFPILELMCEWGEKNITDKYEVINPQCNC